MKGLRHIDLIFLQVWALIGLGSEYTLHGSYGLVFQIILLSCAILVALHMLQTIWEVLPKKLGSKDQGPEGLHEVPE